MHLKMGVCSGDDLQTFHPSEADGWYDRVRRSKVIQTSLTEPDVELSINLTHKLYPRKFCSSQEMFDVWPKPKPECLKNGRDR